MGGIVKHLLPVGSALRILPYVAKFSRATLEHDLTSAGFAIHTSWQPAPQLGVFHICQKPD